MDTNRGFKDTVVRLVALLGLLLVLLLGAWGIILLAFNLPSFASAVGNSIVSLFSYSPAPSPSVTTTTREPAPSSSATAKPTTSTTKQTSGTSYAPTVTYIPATTKAALYGYADLAVRILSINPTLQNRVSIQFEIANVGTNVAPAGWVFDATLPVGYVYTYHSPAQQALYPGDKIVYTLGFNSTYQNQVCTLQYPNPNCPQYQEPYRPYPYQDICYRYDGYQNVPAPCTDTGGDSIYYNHPGYDYRNWWEGMPYHYNRMITIVVDPRNFVYDLNRGNNTASINSPLYY